MYKFSKQSWHVKLFKWIFEEDPTRIYKSMCPYFWSYVLILLFLPIILVVKLFGNWGTKFLNTLRTHQEVKKEKLKQSFLLRCHKENLTKKEAYNLVKSKCWDKFSWYLDYYKEQDIRTLYREMKDEIYHKSLENKDKRQTQYKEIKDSKWFTYLSYIITTGVLLTIIWVFYFLFSMIDFGLIDWVNIGKAFLYIGTATLLVYIAYLIMVYIIIPIINKISCMECQFCKLGIFSNIGKFFIFIGKGFYIIADMIYVTYKKNCPLIEWEEK